MDYGEYDNMPTVFFLVQFVYFQSVIDIHRQEFIDYNNLKATIEIQEELDRRAWKRSGPHTGPGDIH